eukprot:719270_1
MPGPDAFRVGLGASKRVYLNENERLQTDANGGFSEELLLEGVDVVRQYIQNLPETQRKSIPALKVKKWANLIENQLRCPLKFIDFPVIRSKTLAERVVRDLKDEILNAKLPHQPTSHAKPRKISGAPSKSKQHLTARISLGSTKRPCQNISASSDPKRPRYEISRSQYGRKQPPLTDMSRYATGSSNVSHDGEDFGDMRPRAYQLEILERARQPG